MTFDSRQVSPLKSFSQHSVSTANGTSIPIIGEGSLSLTNTFCQFLKEPLPYFVLSFFGLNFVYLRTYGQGKRLVMVLGEGSCITWTWCLKV